MKKIVNVLLGVVTSIGGPIGNGVLAVLTVLGAVMAIIPLEIFGG